MNDRLPNFCENDQFSELTPLVCIRELMLEVDEQERQRR